ncbi:MAG: hypothetical protein OQK78_11715, partial [Gammaproteobacteria bacterium]|nr:hypothetical protein [Gammaproteobacteria bacterium]
MSKHKRVVSIILLLAAVIGIWLFLTIANSQKPQNLKSIEHAASNTSLSHQSPVNASQSQASLSTTSTIKQPKSEVVDEQSMLAKLNPAQVAYYLFGFRGGMEDINFYGQVIDQYDVPVVNAKVPFCTGGALLASGKGCGYTLTDNQGRFEIHSEGGSLTLSAIVHDGIDFNFPRPAYGGLHAANKKQIRFFGYQQIAGGNYPLWTDTSEESPYVFTAWRVAEYENVVIGRDVSHQIPDGRTYTFMLDKKNYKDRRAEGIVDGHLRVSCTRGQMKNHLDKLDWKVILEPVDGGIQTTNDIYLNYAPETGYKPSII